MSKIVYLLIFCFLVGCTDRISEENLAKLNGYWEIEKVVFPDGASKDYSVNTVVDYFQIEGLRGFRKKVQPKFDGTYDTSNDAEPLKIIEFDGSFQLHYSNEMSKWSETLKSLENNTIVLVNEEGVAYHYKRFEPINATGK